MLFKLAIRSKYLFKVMNVGNIILCLFVVLFGYHAWNVYSAIESPHHIETPDFLVSKQVGRTRQIQSKNGDASMAIEYTRRRAIAAQRYCSINTLGLPKKAIRETRTSTGQTTGYLESFFISSLCTIAPAVSAVPPGGGPFPATYTIFDGLDANGEPIQYVLDGNGDIVVAYDGGGA
jgi:hypothetical protein